MGRCSPPSTADEVACRKLSDAVDDRDSASNLALASWIAAGVFAAGTSVATFLLWPDGEGKPAGRHGPEVRADFGLHRGSVSLQGTF
jgi:hypothetical protein